MTDVRIPADMNMKVISLKKGDILVVKRPKAAGTEFTDRLEDLAEEIAANGVSVIILEVGSFDDFKLLSDQDLDELDLVHKSKVLAFKDQPFQELLSEWEEPEEKDNE